jgi:YD repeat-containing protein
MQATYTHDNLGRLTQVVYDNGSSVVYSYDAVGNRTSVVRVGSLSATDGDPSVSQMRATLTQGDHWGLTNVTNGGVLYVEPIFDGRIGIWNGAATYRFKSTPLSLSLTGLAAGNYRLYVYDSNDDAIVDAGELVAWSGNTPPSDTLVADGYLVNASATNRRAVADIMLHGTGQCDWSESRRGICHIDERSRCVTALSAFPSEDSWAVPGSTTWRRVAGGSTAGQHFVEFILSSTTLVSADAIVTVDRSNGSGLLKYHLGFGLDATNANSATQPFGYDENIIGLNAFPASARLRANIAVGKHTLNLIEQNLSNRNADAYGDNGETAFKSGMLVEIML